MGGYMDVNLTGQVAANLIQNPIMIMSASAIGGLIAGSLTLLGVWITQKRAREQEEENRKEESHKAQREERKKAYLDSIDFLLKSTKDGDADPLELGHCVAILQLLGSENILIKMAPMMHEIVSEKGDLKKRVISYCRIMEEVIPIMRKELLLVDDNEITDQLRAEAEQYWQKVGKE